MVQISSPFIIQNFTFIRFSHLLILLLLWLYILMESPNPLSLIFHVIMFLIYHSFFSLISNLGRCYIKLEERYMIHITILQLYNELIVLLIVLIFVFFGKEYAHINSIFLIMFLYQSLLVEIIIHIMILLHKMMIYKESLLFLLADSTL